MIETEVRSIEVRPQPIGIYSGPASALLLPSTHALCRDNALSELLNGKGTDVTEWPPEWRFYRAALEGKIDEAVVLLEETSGVSKSDVNVRDYNRFVLQPSQEKWIALQKRCDGFFGWMLETAAFNVGLGPKLPASSEVTDDELDHELLAWGLASVAASEMERESYVTARQNLGAAIEACKDCSPLLAAILLAQSAYIAHHFLELPASLVRRDYEAAIEIAKESSLPSLTTELWTQLGMLLQASAGSNREEWMEAIRAYQSALQSDISSEVQPALFAELHNNLGLAYLAMPGSETSNQLRSGIAIQSFRHAMEPLDPVTHSDLWARIKMNLANALQYAPSSHPETNLIQAVQIYDEILEVRTRAKEPIAYALVLLNQANALAHLGIFKPSLEKASEAYKLFQWYNQSEQAATARELVERVNDSLSSAKRDEPTPTITTA